MEASSGAWLGTCNTLKVEIIIEIPKTTCSGSEEPEPRSPEVAEPPLPGEEEEREEP